MRYKLILPASLIVAAPAAYLLWPLRTNDFVITWNDEEIERKDKFIAELAAKSRPERVPNILFIIADDLGVNDISYYGTGKVATPHIDAIARDGISFDQAYTASPVCSPSRASMLTGRYPQRFGFQYQMHDRYLKNRLEYYGFKYFVKSEPWGPSHMEKVPGQKEIDRQGLPPSEVTISEILQAGGYATALIGKWHLGWDEQNKPCKFGFDYQYGFFDSNSLYSPEGTEGIRDQKIKDDFTDKYMWKDGRKGPRAIYRNCAPVDEKEHLTDAITRECIDFIQQENKNPFFIMAAYNAPHTPLQAPERYVDMFSGEPDPVRQVYYAMIKHLDDNVGELMAELDRQGLAENTLVIFVSDNGGATYTQTTDNGPLRGGKITDFEGGLRVPFFMKWPGFIPPGSRYQAPVITLDIFATMAAASHSSLPSGQVIDAVDLIPFIQSDSTLPHPHLYWQRGNSRAIRSLDWKVIWNEAHGDTLIYNIARDPEENRNLIATHSDLARQLIRIHHDWSRQLPPPLWPSIVDFREEVDGRWFYFDN